MEQDYKKSWNTLKAESGGRWCQPHPLSNELLTIGELMRNMERRASETAELAATDSQQIKQSIMGICESVDPLEENFSVLQKAMNKIYALCSRT
jgi:hypothetical protein